MDGLPNELLERMLAPARRALEASERELLDRILAAGSSAAAQLTGRVGATAGAVPGDVTAALFRLVTLIAKLPHAAAEALLDTDRGTVGVRALTAGEATAIQAAWGVKLDTRPIRIVAGHGLSLIALCAFMHGNPAITIGNTIYVKSGPRVPMDDFSKTSSGGDTLLHESTHVQQYATIGFKPFLDVYLAELTALRGDVNKMYDYQSRQTTWL